MLNKMILSVFLVVISIALYNCSEEEQPPEPTITAPGLTPIAYDESLKVVRGNSPEQTESGFLGYYLYIANTNLANVPDSLLNNYRVWSTPSFQNDHIIYEYESAPLDSNARYYFGIKAVRHKDSGDTLSPMRVVETSPVWMGSSRI